MDLMDLMDPMDNGRGTRDPMDLMDLMDPMDDGRLTMDDGRGTIWWTITIIPKRTDC